MSQEMVVLSRLVLDDMTSFEAVACIRSIQALDSVKTPGAASMYLRHRVLAASGQKGYKSNYEIWRSKSALRDSIRWEKSWADSCLHDDMTMAVCCVNLAKTDRIPVIIFSCVNHSHLSRSALYDWVFDLHQRREVFIPQSPNSIQEAIMLTKSKKPIPDKCPETTHTCQTYDIQM